MHERLSSASTAFEDKTGFIVTPRLITGQRTHQTVALLRERIAQAEGTAGSRG